jgi:hypothetical protein
MILIRQMKKIENLFSIEFMKTKTLDILLLKLILSLMRPNCINNNSKNFLLIGLDFMKIMNIN